MIETLTPTLEQIENLRDLFFKKLDRENPPCNGEFHPDDIERIKFSNRWLQLFLEQQDLDMKQSLNMLWETCIWRKTYGTNDICEDNIRIDYLKAGIMFPHSKDIDGKSLLIFKTKLHTKGTRNTTELVRCLVYWIERIHRQQNYDQITFVFDMHTAGLSNMDMDFTRQIIDTFKLYYPNSLQYIVIYEMPWILNAAFKIIKGLLPAKAVARMKFVNSKTINSVIPEENMLKCWGGLDDYEFNFLPENKIQTPPKFEPNSKEPQDKMINSNNILQKKVHFANINSTETQMISKNTESDTTKKSEGEFLRVIPGESINFTQTESEFCGLVEITNISQNIVTYKIKTTSPGKFRVRPSTGKLSPGATAVINVVLQPGEEISVFSKDKFLVMCLPINEEQPSNIQSLTEFWKNLTTNESKIEQHRLFCSLDNAEEDIRQENNINLNHKSENDNYGSWICSLTENQYKLEKQVKFMQRLQMITIALLFLISIILVVYNEYKDPIAGHCMKEL